ncbi:MAG: hypothetical protein CR982_00440 [Candidatus Cloacimonadota bacterium]|nr:MAG: hypothetical protein CR982_00440 [Candidatus Cloacimonadota bacterium]PIE78768.1 MAG: hypothetical protein CSA15_06200 [Candidatus Delongbacteria bacterium]
MSGDKLFWNKLANIYNKMFENKKAYQKIYSLIRESVNKEMKVLEVGTATGMIARAISPKVKEVFAIDFSDKMIVKAKEITKEKNIFFSIQDSSNLQFKDSSFDLVIIANVLHIIKDPEKILGEIKRVLKSDGILIAPTFMWKELNLLGKIQKFVMVRRGFPIYSQWNREEYISFLEKNGLICIKKESINWSFNICYVECKKR